MNRRAFIRVGAAGGASLFVFAGRGFVRHAAAQIPGGSLGATDLEQFVLPLVKPPAMPGRSNRNKDMYRIGLRQFSQQILPPPHPPTTVWSYGSIDHPGTVAQGGTFHYPAFTIEATWNKQVQVLWRNELVDAAGNFLPHLLPVDPTLHWANPPGGRAGRDTRPFFNATPDRYRGPVPMVTHVHGIHTTEDSDGYAEAWYLPDANDIPADYARTGTFFDYYNAKYRHQWDAGTVSFKYPNDQPAATLWYHDHTLGMTRLNVYAGPAGFYLIRGGPGDQVNGVLPGPAPGVGDDPFGTYYEIPLAIQDRSFNADGSLFYPDSRSFFDGYEGPYSPETPVAPIWNPEFFGNMMVVNGRTWPFLNVERRRYRFRLLNGCNSRFLVLKLTRTPRTHNGGFNAPGGTFWQIGAEGGFLPQVAALDHVLLSPAERADVIVDFSAYQAGDEVYLVNDGPDAPFGAISTEDLADWQSTGLVMKFVVGPGPAVDPSTHPASLGLPEVQKPGQATKTRHLSLNEEEYEAAEIPFAAMLGTFDPATGQATPMMWHEPVSENPDLGDTEIWAFYNDTADAHPIHMHQVQFEVLGREPVEGGLSVAGSNGPMPGETGLKDTVIAYPGEVTRVKAHFDLPGFFVWHCHIVEHEDNEMMRPFHVGPMPVVADSGQKGKEKIQLSNYPQPFNPTTSIRFDLPVDSNVRLEVFDLSGRRVAMLVDGPMSAGIQQVSFDGSMLPSGVYLSRLTAAGQQVTIKLLLMK